MKNPLVNALLAELYIVVVASIMFYGEKVMGDKPDSVFAPIAFLSLFVLSASVMGFLFFSVPIREYLDGNKELAVKSLVSTISYFGLLTFSMFVIVFVTSRF